MGPPATVLEMGKFIHACEGEMVIESTNPKIPHFNAPIYLENKVRRSFPLAAMHHLPPSIAHADPRQQLAKSTRSSAP